MNTHEPVHPGAIFFEDIIKPLGLTISETAEKLGVSGDLLTDFIEGKLHLTAELAIRIGQVTATSPESWMTMQSRHDLWKLQHEKVICTMPFSRVVA